MITSLAVKQKDITVSSLFIILRMIVLGKHTLFPTVLKSSGLRPSNRGSLGRFQQFYVVNIS